MEITEKIDKYLEVSQIEKELDEAFKEGYNNLQSLNIEEQDEVTTPINEEAVSVTLIISTLLAMPSIVESIAKSIGWIYKKIKKLFKKEEEETEAVEKIIKVSEKWHKSYITVLKQILRFSGVFKQVGAKKEETKDKITESIFYLIILGFAFHGGIAAYSSISEAINHMHLGYGKKAVLKTALTHLKVKEVKNFVSELIK